MFITIGSLWNQTPDVHRGCTFITWCWRYITWRWRHRNHADTIASEIAAKQTVINQVYDVFLFVCFLINMQSINTYLSIISEHPTHQMGWFLVYCSFSNLPTHQMGWFLFSWSFSIFSTHQMGWSLVSCSFSHFPTHQMGFVSGFLVIFTCSIH